MARFRDFIVYEFSPGFFFPKEGRNHCALLRAALCAMAERKGDGKRKRHAADDTAALGAKPRNWQGDEVGSARDKHYEHKINFSLDDETRTTQRRRSAQNVLKDSNRTYSDRLDQIYARRQARTCTSDKHQRPMRL